MIEQRLLQAAEDLCRSTGRRPREAFMRRAASTAYYALFHCLCRMCADELVGGGRSSDAWDRVYRAVDHRAAKDALLSKAAAATHPVISDVGRAFAALQKTRHDADYSPQFFRFYFDEARKAISDLNGLNAEARRALATLVLFKPRGGGAKP